jgi:hypothetical protein
VVAAQIEGRVNNREEKNRDYRDAYRPHAHLPEIRRRRNTCRTGIQSTAFGPAPLELRPQYRRNRPNPNQRRPRTSICCRKSAGNGREERQLIGLGRAQRPARSRLVHSPMDTTAVAGPCSPPSGSLQFTELS